MNLLAANRAQATAHQVKGVFKQVDNRMLDIRRNLNPMEIEHGPSSAGLPKCLKCMCIKILRNIERKNQKNFIKS